MPLIRPFAALRPAPKYVDAVIAPPYDVLNSAEARQQAEGRDESFLHISKPEIDLAPDIDPFSDVVYATGLAHFLRMIKSGVLKQDEKSQYYLYGLSTKNIEQIGLVAVANVEDYKSNRIRKHELTRPDKEDDRTRQINTLNAQTGPVLLTYKHDATLDELIKKLTAQPPVFDVTADDKVTHKLWCVEGEAHVQLITEIFDNMDYLYIADGHHRSAAASRVADLRRAENPNHTGDESYNYFLSVIFPDNQMQILDYNRVVQDLNGLSKTAFLDKFSENFEIKSRLYPVKPQKNGEFGMFLAGQWYQLVINHEKIPNDPIGRLDVSLLTNNVLNPILGITDLRRDKRIDFVGGIRGLSELEKRVNSGEMAVAFSLYPTSMADLMAVADAGKMMPPKSTWFEPKLADGLVSHLL